MQQKLVLTHFLDKYNKDSVIEPNIFTNLFMLVIYASFEKQIKKLVFVFV